MSACMLFVNQGTPHAVDLCGGKVLKDFVWG